MKKRFICNTKQVSPGEPFVFQVNNEEQAVLFQTPKGYFAIENRCPHAGAFLKDGIIDAEELTCIWHGWKFNLETGKCLNEPVAKIKTYPVLLEGEQIFINDTLE